MRYLFPDCDPPSSSCKLRFSPSSSDPSLDPRLLKSLFVPAEGVIWASSAYSVNGRLDSRASYLVLVSSSQSGKNCKSANMVESQTRHKGTGKHTNKQTTLEGWTNLVRSRHTVSHKSLLLRTAVARTPSSPHTALRVIPSNSNFQLSYEVSQLILLIYLPKIPFLSQ